MFVIFTIAAPSRHSKLDNPAASRYDDAYRAQHHSNAQRDGRSRHHHTLRRLADVHPTAPGR